MTETVDGKVSSTQLVTLNPEQYVTAAFAPFKERLAAAVKASKKVSYDVTTKEGMVTAKEQRKLFKDIRIGVDNARKEQKAPIIEIGRLLDSRSKEIVEEAAAIEELHDAKIKAEEARIEEENAARIREEELRKAAIRNAITEIMEAPSKAISMNAAQTLELLDKVKATEINRETFGDQDIEAENAKYKAVETLTQLHTSKVAQEAAELAEQERKAREGAERAEQARIDGIKARIAAIEKAASNAAMADTSAEIQALINTVEATVIDASFAEFQNEAEGVKVRVLKAMKRTLNMVKGEEDEAAAALEAQTPVVSEPVAETAPVEKEPVKAEPVVQPAAANNVQQFGETRRTPTRQEIINVIAMHFDMGPDRAEKLLTQTFQIAKAA
jgi:hypothetical protein